MFMASILGNAVSKPVGQSLRIGCLCLKVRGSTRTVSRVI